MIPALGDRLSAVAVGQPVIRAPRRGLVIGAGAALAGAWALGVLCALHEFEGYDPATVDVVVGTSAGSVLNALIGCGVPPRQMAERLAGGRADIGGTEPVNPLDVDDAVHRALGNVRLPIPLRQRGRRVHDQRGRAGP